MLYEVIASKTNHWTDSRIYCKKLYNYFIATLNQDLPDYDTKRLTKMDFRNLSPSYEFMVVSDNKK